MSFYLSKFLPLFVYPTGLAWLILLSMCIYDGVTRQWSGRSTVALCALLVLWIGGNHYVAHWLIHSLERQHPPLNEAAYNGEVAVVLGGATRWQVPPRPLPEISELGDRIIYAAHLYKAGTADRLVLTGGWLDWQTGDGIGNSEAHDMQVLLGVMGVPAEATLLEEKSLNTYENAVFTKKLLDEAGIERVLLITSASHMPRSVAIFEKQGIQVIPAPTDFYVTEIDTGSDSLALDWSNALFHLIPQSSYLSMTSLAMKEYIGQVVYTLRGWQ